MTITLHVDFRAVFAGFVLLVAAAAIATPVAISLADDNSPTNSPFADFGSAFVYQGRLEVDGLPANGTYDYRYTHHPEEEATAEVGAPLTQALAVANGHFVASLDFGAGAFDGSSRWLAVEARPEGLNNYVALLPRQALAPTPYAIYAQTAPSGGISSCPDGLDDGDNDALTSLACTNGQVAKKSGATWVCDEDIIGSPGSTYTADPGGGLILNRTAFLLDTEFTDARYWKLGGNDLVTTFLGTNDLAPLEFRVNGERALLIEPGYSPNIVGGSYANWARAGIAGATISGGGATLLGTFCANENQVRDAFGTVGGGCGNAAGLGNDSGPFATVGGGYRNTASGYRATVGGGNDHRASGETSTIAGGNTNLASGYGATVSGGSGNTASGETAVVPGGSFNFAIGSGSFAAGTSARSNNPGCFTWADLASTQFNCNTDNKFQARARGGVQFVTSLNLSTGCSIAAGGIAWSCTSDRNAKTNFSSTNGRDVLAKVAGLQVETWNAKTEDPSIRHMGVMAQDFYSAFGLGDSDLTIATVDADGVAFAAIQGLNSIATEQDARIAALEAKLAAVESSDAPQPPAATNETIGQAEPGTNRMQVVLAAAMTLLAIGMFSVTGAILKRGRA